MKLNEIKIDNLIYLRKNKKYNNIYDVLLTNFQQINKCETFECHFTLYPFDRNIKSDDFKFNPFEEYADDIISEHRSVYIPIADNSKKLFGCFLGILITIAFAYYKPEILISVESIVSIFAAYTFGKEFWDDIQKGMVRLSKNWRLSYIQNYYSYSLEKGSTLTRYSTFARKMRLDNIALLPKLFDFIYQSNSQTLRLKFDSDDFINVTDDVIHLFSIKIEEEKAELFEKSGFLFGVKLSLNKSSFGIKKSLELFQSLNGKSFGCLDNSNVWLENNIFYRNTNSKGRFKYFKNKGLLKDKSLIKKNF
jgi:hypothetical protein